MSRLSARFGWQAGFCFGVDDGARKRRWTGSTALCGFDDAGLHRLDGARLAQVASSPQIVAAAEGRRSATLGALR